MSAPRGFTLLELLVTIVILSFALAIAIPPLSQGLQANAVKSATRQLHHMVRLGRHEAVFGGTRVILCSLDENSNCRAGWQEDLVMFTDGNRNNRLDGSDRLIRHWNRDGDRVLIRWRGFGPGYLRFRSSGYAAENGSFTICPADGDLRRARQLIVNRVGRAYRSRDRDGDGIVDYGNNKKPSC